MSRRALLIGLAVAALLLTLGLRSWNLALSQVERSVVAGIETRTGLKVTGMRRAEIAILPLPRISLSDVSFVDPQGVLSGKAARLRARARLLPLIGGQLDFDRIDLVAPEIDVAASDSGGSYALWLDRILGYLARLDSQTRLVLNSGSVMMRSDSTVLTTLRDVNLLIEERTAQAPVALAGSFTWRGEATKVDILWPVAGERARTAFSLGSRLMNLRLNGTRSAAQGTTSGQVEFSTKSLSDALAWIGPRPRIASLVRQVELTAQAQISPGSAALDSVVAMVDGDQLEGALKLDGAMPNWALSGTLAGAEFDLGRLLRQAEPQMPAGSGETADTPLEFDGWTTNDVDLRLSLDSARIGAARFGDLAAQLLIRKGRFEASLLRASAYGGSARARILATPVTAGADVKLQLGLEKVNLALVADDLPALARLSGTATGQLAFDGVGSSLEQVVSSLTGRAGLTIRQGEFRGIAFPDLLRKAEKPPTSARDWRQGKSAFETLQLSALANLGVLYVTDTQIAGSGYNVVLNGTADLTRRWLDLNGALSSTTTSARVPFELRGPFFGAAFTPEIDAALRPIGPAIPLLR
ncbi:MAG: AsmA-like C-terminal region-containing protein [Bosea sp.]|uniref:AsmA family protein n=1 Tax=Bosea sp. (in: a-proteobacteria) TaxID=1871050 RepID=UPI0023922950|nr:AsmA-like C-terminal region-containing protein [Bosea sp. (in: a-proteobacteria)]MCP4735583.1 AsmA-like C-terminal region-containing protein [Bosea sp. (in: a-proteobacteria)]